MQNIQDIRIKQGLIGSESGLILGFFGILEPGVVYTKCYKKKEIIF